MPPRTITSLESACRAPRLALSSGRNGECANGRTGELGGSRWWGEAPERPISLRSAYGLYGLIVGNVGTRAEPLVQGCGNFETKRRNENS
jgi:hypothetical protein